MKQNCYARIQIQATDKFGALTKDNEIAFWGTTKQDLLNILGKFQKELKDLLKDVTDYDFEKEQNELQ